MCVTSQTNIRVRGQGSATIYVAPPTVREEQKLDSAVAVK